MNNKQQIYFRQTFSQQIGDENYQVQDFSQKNQSQYYPNQKQKLNQNETILKQNFSKSIYPINFFQVNPFCPKCGKFVDSKVSSKVYESKVLKRKYIAHEQCLNKESAFCFNTLAEINEAHLTFINSNYHDGKRSLFLGGKQFYLELNISHPVSGFSFIKMCSKIKSKGNNIFWQLKNPNITDGFYPNVIALPVPDFDITICKTQMANKDNKSTIKAFINTEIGTNSQVKVLKASTEDLEVMIRIIPTKEEKQSIINMMNYKYRYPLDINLPLIEITKVTLLLKNMESDEEDNSIIGISQEPSYSQASIFSENHEKSFQGQALSDKSLQKDNIDLQKLISTKQLGQYVRNNTQSRAFQSFLKDAPQNDVDNIIKTLYLELPELITHEYANYMIQKLFSICNLAQRLRIIERLQGQFPVIVRNKQGTHTIQTLISFFMNEQEYNIVCSSIKSSFFQLSQHPNATHFIQKVIKQFPVAHTIQFFNLANQNFITFVVDKNAMCVIKHMMKKIKEIISSKDKSMPLILQIKKHFINSVTFNIDKIIQDCYGNYIIQFCFEMYGQQQCLSITEMILERFSQFSIQKYSGNVVLKCITNYWKQKTILDKLKSRLNHQTIRDMYRNRDGNKVLLEIMQKKEGTTLWQKVYGQLIQEEPTKFLHEQWQAVLGVRSGMVGTEFNSFSDAVKKLSPSRKKR